MKKFVNSVDDLVPNSVAGLVGAHEDLLALNVDPLFVHRRAAKRDRVALLSGGGSGHEPLHTGYVGPGMLDADTRPDCCGSGLRRRRARRAVDRKELCR